MTHILMRSSHWDPSTTSGWVMYSLILSNAYWWWASHLNSFTFFNLSNGEKAWISLVVFKINLHRKYILPIGLWSSFLFLGDWTWIIAFALFLSTSHTSAPKNLRSCWPTQRTHTFVGSTLTYTYSSFETHVLGQPHVYF